MNEHKLLQDNFKKKQRKAVLKLVALLLVIATLISTAAWSWFTDNQYEVTAGDVVLMMESQEKLEMSVNGGPWTTYLAYDTSNLDMEPLTGLGDLIDTNKDGKPDKVNLHLPETKLVGGTTVVNPDVEWTKEVVPGLHYISLEVEFKTEFKANIYIGEGTSVITECEDKGMALADERDPTNIYNISKDGNFTRDAVAGALRMSVCYPTESDLKFIWIPRPEIELYKNLSNEYKLFLTPEDYDKDDIRNHWSAKHNFYKADRNYAERDACAASEHVFKAKENNSNGADSLTLIGSTEAGTTCKVYLKIWIEGTDAEAVRALSRGRFRINLNFVAVEQQS